MNNNMHFNRNASFWEIMERKKPQCTLYLSVSKEKVFLQTAKAANGLELQAVEDP